MAKSPSLEEQIDGLDGWLPPGVVFEGNHRFDGPVRIDGVFRGQLQGGDWVQVAAEGTVDGEMLAPQVLVDGQVKGSLVAMERATLREGSLVQGHLRTPWLDARPGHQIKGTIEVIRS